MINRLSRVTLARTQSAAGRTAAWTIFVRDTLSGFVTTARHLLMVLGITALAALTLMFVQPQFADRLKAVSPFAQPQAANEEQSRDDPAFAMQAQALDTAPAALAVPVSTDKAFAGDARQQQWVTNWLSRRYRVAADATNMLVSAAYLTASEIKLDPLLILSVMAIESGFNPFAESPVGAQGLMQVMSKVHHDKFEELGGVKAALNPVANIRVGSQILKDYVTRGGSVEAGLKLYVGAGAMESDSGYGAKVLAEYRRLKDVAMGKKVPVNGSAVVAAPAKPRAEPKPLQAEDDSNGSSPELNQADKVAAL
ncbi:lytic transglycosylase domain-containing protein [Noviherbaspirillum aridicola]|uniref:Lipoprotein n=1 Tax=Noviherbaspirillum aridicola TaxID=2849687 RepID=A0ABQ4QA08_9BURK|nr:lytic transglycosylase domain-containing protein [Noviherbaspirillum aridicola]GIZ53826.1 lipoprotein [Noviherbaspirillum aridicola]